jgi:hypothetical protein
MGMCRSCRQRYGTQNGICRGCVRVAKQRLAALRQLEVDELARLFQQPAPPAPVPTPSPQIRKVRVADGIHYEVVWDGNVRLEGY